MDFGALPPEINSIRMYSGAGSGSLMAASAAWDGLATELQSSAASYGSAVSGLTNAWSGPSSASMAAAAAPYVAWMTTTAAQAEQAASQAKAAAGAYEAAFLMTVPPPVVAANRSLLTSLVATNILGQNTPAIAVTEAHYTEMWAQDAAAMYGYAGASAIATQVTPFTPPPPTTNPAGTATQGAAAAQATGTSAGTHAATTLSQAISATPTALQSLASPVSFAAPAAVAAPATPLSFLSTLDSFITGSLSPFSLFPIGGVPYLLGIQSYLLPQAAANLTSASEKASKIGMGPALGGGLGSTGSLASSGLGGAGSTVSAGMGRASLVGRLSVPQNWASAAPAMRSVAAVLPETGLGAAPAVIAAEGQGSLYSGMGLSGLAGRAMVGTGGSAVRFVPATGVVAPGEATTATIIVLPPDE